MTVPVVTLGSIPALAGERKMRRENETSHGVYPRACGGTVNEMSVLGSSGGLSPRLRGNVTRCEIHIVIPGSIPALAGERRSRLAPADRSGVYPRACGGTLQ